MSSGTLKPSSHVDKKAEYLLLLFVGNEAYITSEVLLLPLLVILLIKQSPECTVHDYLYNS